MKKNKVSRDRDGELEALRGRVAELEATLAKRERPQAAPGEDEQKYRALLENTDVAICEIDANGVFLFANQVSAEIVRAKTDGLVGRTIWDVFPKNIADGQISRIRGAIRSGQAYTRETCMEVDGRTCWYQTAVRPLKDDRGRASSVLVVAPGVTERKLTEQALRASEEKYRLLFEAAPVGIGIAGPRGKFIASNRYMEEITGYLQDELELIDYDSTYVDVDQRKQFLKTLQKRGRVRDFEVALKRKDGTVYSALVNADQIELGGEKLVLGTIRDISLLKRAEDALRESEERFRDLFEHSKDAIFIHNLDGRIQDVNGRACEMLGYERSQLLGMPLRSLHPKEDRAAGAAALRATRKDKSARFESRFRKADGSIVDVEISASIFDEDKGIVAGIARDITQRKRAEESLRQRQQAERRFGEQLTVLHALTNELSTAGSFDELCRRAVELGRSRLGFDRMGLWFVGDKPNTVVGSFGTDAKGQTSDERALRNHVTPGTLAWKALQGRIRVAVSLDDPFYDLDGKLVDRGQRVVASLWDGQKVIGFISADNLLRGEPITDSHGELLGLYASALGHLATRKRAEEELSQSRQRLQSIIDNTSDIIFQVDLEGNYTFANKAAERIAGYPLTKLLRMNMGELAAPQYREELFERLRKRIRGEPLEQPFEFEIISRDRRRIALELTTTGVHEEGKLVGIQGIARDVTARKQAEAALRESEARFQNLVDNLPVGIYRNTPGARGKFLMANRALARLHGYESLEEFLAIDAAELYESPAERKAFSDKLIARGGLAGEEVRLTRKDGTFIWGSMRTRVVRDEEGKVKYFDGVVEDITERKRAEEALRESEAQMRLILEHSSDGIDICEMDPKTHKRRLLMCNDRFVEMSGRSREELMAAEDISELAQGLSTPQEDRLVTEQLRKLLPARGRASWNRPDGKENYYEWTAAPIEVGDKLYMIGVDRDVTESMRTEAALSDARRRLTTAHEQERKHLTAELHDSVGQGLIALQLALRTMSKSFEDSGDTERAENAAQLRKQCDALIREIRGICRGLYPRSLELGVCAALEEVAGDFQAETKVTVNCGLPAKAGSLPADVEIALFRIAQEGITNAVRHGQAKNVSVEVGYEDEEAVLAITDDGAGFDPAEAAGKGLGLSMMQERLQTVSGTMTIDSGPKGTRICVRVPAKASAAQDN